jgi:putative aldouronate transport system permease protein
MVGLQIAFRDYNIGLGVWGSRWVGFKYFRTFLNSFEFPRLLGNTLAVGVYLLAVGMPCPIILALSINSCANRRYGKAAQMITYAPYFISVVILVTITMQFLAVRGGMLNNMRAMLGAPAINLMSKPGAFRHIYVWSDVWQTTGYGAVIYIAALSGVHPELYEAATIDGASIIQRIWHIDLPSIMPVAVILLIMKCGGVINVGHEKVLLLQNPMNQETADVISTYVYRIGITAAQYSYSSAIGFFNSVVSITLLLSANFLAGKISETSLF